MKHIVLLWSFLAVAAVAACGTESTGDGDDDPPLTGDKYELRYGPVTVPPGVEATKCINVRLSNTAAIKVHQMRNVLTGGSHHLILYKDDMSTTERAAPYDCEPFTGALNPSGMVAPVMITQKHEDALTLPDRVAYTFAPNQMVRIEMHYINSTDAPLEVSAVSELYALPDSAIDHEANILFIGTPDINIPAGATMDVQAYFTPSRAQLDLAGAKFFAITGHTHQHGRNVTVGTATSAGGTPTSVYAPSPFSWSEPETAVHRPEFTMPAGLQSGFSIKCSYHNTSSSTVRFGESANDEMCFFWAYYYPSKGAHVCIRTQMFGGVDICCPDAGPTICNMVNQL